MARRNSGGRKKKFRCDCILCKRRRNRRKSQQPIPLTVPVAPWVGISQFLVEIAFRGLESWIRDHGYVGASGHPESREAINISMDEHQMGRSEVVREISRPKKN